MVSDGLWGLEEDQSSADECVSSQGVSAHREYRHVAGIQVEVQSSGLEGADKEGMTTGMA